MAGFFGGRNFVVSANGVLKQEPVIVSKFVPLGMMLPVQEQPVEEKKTEKSFEFLPSLIFAGLLIASIWYICWGWEMFR